MKLAKLNNHRKTNARLSGFGGLGGFSIVELIVALSVTSVLLVLLFKVFNDSSTLWATSNDRMDTYREARAGLDMMSRELSKLVIPQQIPADFPILALKYQEDTPDEDRVNHEIYALTELRNRWGIDPCAVGYRCEWDEKKRAYILFRRALDAKETYGNLQTVLNAASPLQGDAAFKALFFGPYKTFDDPGKSSSDALSFPIASYVWDFQVSIPESVDGSKTYPFGSFAQTLPDWLEIRFRAVGEPVARRLEGVPITRETWFGREQKEIYERRIKPYEQQFVTRVRIRK